MFAPLRHNLPLFLVAFGLFPVGLGAQSVKLYNIQLDGCRLRFSPDLSSRAREMKTALNQGLRRLATLVGSPGIPDGCVFWLVTDEEEMHAVLTEAVGISATKDRDRLEQIIHMGIYQDERQVVLRSPAETPLDWQLRLLFSRYAGMLIDATTPYARSHRVGWLYAGLMAYLGWQVAAEIENPLITDADTLRRLYESQLENYYRGYFDADRARELRDLGEDDSYRRAVLLGPAQVQAQSVLTYLYLTQKAGPLVGVRLLRIYEEDTIFATAFRRATGMELTLFENEMRDRVYPLYRRTAP